MQHAAAAAMAKRSNTILSPRGSGRFNLSVDTIEITKANLSGGPLSIKSMGAISLMADASTESPRTLGEGSPSVLPSPRRSSDSSTTSPAAKKAFTHVHTPSVSTFAPESADGVVTPQRQESKQRPTLLSTKHLISPSVMRQSIVRATGGTMPCFVERAEHLLSPDGDTQRQALVEDLDFHEAFARQGLLIEDVFPSPLLSTPASPGARVPGSPLSPGAASRTSGSLSPTSLTSMMSPSSAEFRRVVLLAAVLEEMEQMQVLYLDTSEHTAGSQCLHRQLERKRRELLDRTRLKALNHQTHGERFGALLRSQSAHLQERSLSQQRRSEQHLRKTRESSEDRLREAARLRSERINTALLKDEQNLKARYERVLDTTAAKDASAARSLEDREAQRSFRAAQLKDRFQQVLDKREQAFQDEKEKCVQQKEQLEGRMRRSEETLENCAEQLRIRIDLTKDHAAQREFQALRVQRLREFYRIKHSDANAADAAMFKRCGYLRQTTAKEVCALKEQLSPRISAN